MPFAFEPTQYSGKLSIDGGALQHIDPEAAIKRCLEMVPNQQDIVIDMINVGGDGKGVIDGSSPPFT